MIGILTTYGADVPLYQREASCPAGIDPIVFVQLEAQSLAKGTGNVAAVFSGGDGREYRSVAIPVDVD